jgi:hypothetical protein
MAMPDERTPPRRKSRDHPGMRVVYTSGYAAFADEPIGAEEMVLQKPFTRDALLTKVHDAFLTRQAEVAGSKAIA